MNEVHLYLTNKQQNHMKIYGYGLANARVRLHQFGYGSEWVLYIPRTHTKYIFCIIDQYN